MGIQCDPRPVRLPPRVDHFVREFAKKKGLTINQAIVHVLSKGISQIEAEENFHIEKYIENFFEKE
jgi:hypothetical protein